MIPILYPSTTRNVADFGAIGRLAECISCKITEDLYGTYELELQYPTNGRYAKDLLGDGIIEAVTAFRPMGPSSGTTEIGAVAKRVQLFDIRRRVIADDIITLTCHHISYRLNNYIVNGISNVGTRALSNAANYIFSNAVPTLVSGAVFYPFTFRDKWVENRTAAFESVATKSVRSFLTDSWYSIRTEYGVEVQFNNWDVEIVSRMGKDEGYEVRLGKNFARGEYDKDETETFNALVPYWVREGQGKVVCNPLLVQPTTPITPVKAIVKDFTNDFENQPTAAELKTYAQAYLDNNTPWIPHETTHVEIYPRDKFGQFPYKVKPELAIGDTLTVFWADADVIGTKMRIVSAVYDSLAEEYETLELGDIQNGYVLTGEW